jgi:CheY-like chemotaxis protein
LSLQEGKDSRQPVAASKGVEEAMRETADSGLRVLLVEDVDFNVEILEDLLTAQGWQSLAARSGEAALQTLATDRDFDIILMDIGLPGMDGVAACRQIRQEPGLAGIPVLALTAEGAEERERLLAAGFDGYLEKTFVAEELHAAVVALVRRQPQRRDEEKPLRKPAGSPLLRTDILLNTYGAREAILQVARAFFSGTDRQMSMLTEAHGKGDLQGIRDCCHSIRGAAAFFSAPSLAAAVEELGTCTGPKEKRAALRRLTEEYDSLRSFVREWLADPDLS